jgi:putative MATE family efflux protein
MHDLTRGPLPGHILKMAAPIAIGMVFQTLYYLVDLYFVARISDTAVAGVSAAGNVQFLVMALTQILGVGTMALISHATGRKDQADAQLIFNQSLLLSASLALMTLLGGFVLTPIYMQTLGADAETIAAGTQYLYWYTPGLALQFALVAMGSALRGTGIARPTMVVQMLSVLLNALLAPILIAGWITGKPLGVAGAGLASSLSIAAGVLMMWIYFIRLEHYVGFDKTQFRIQLGVWKRILRIGMPAGGEFALMFVYMAVIYWVIREFGASAQAAYGAGSRVMQAIFLPAMAIAFATAPVAGQNFGARQFQRVRATFRTSMIIGSSVMLILTLLCQYRPELLLAIFTKDAAIITIGGEFLRIISWNFVAAGIIFTCSSMFQALGNTLPSLWSSCTRLVTFVPPAIWLAGYSDFELRHLWWLSVLTVALQALFSLYLLRGQMRKVA